MIYAAFFLVANRSWAAGGWWLKAAMLGAAWIGHACNACNRRVKPLSTDKNHSSQNPCTLWTPPHHQAGPLCPVKVSQYCCIHLLAHWHTVLSWARPQQQTAPSLPASNGRQLIRASRACRAPGMSAPKSNVTGQPMAGNRRRTKQDCCDGFLEQLRERGDIDIGAAGFIEGICQHFERLPTRYALDVNTDSLDVLSHKRLLDEARLDPTTVSFAVRSVEVLHSRYRESSDGLPSPAFPEVSCCCCGGARQATDLACCPHASSCSLLTICCLPLLPTCSRHHGAASCSQQHAGSRYPSQHLAPHQTFRCVCVCVCVRSQLATVVPSLLMPAVCNRGDSCLLGNACKCSTNTRGTFVCDRCRRVCAAHRHLLWSLGSVLTPRMTALRRTVQQQQQLTAPSMRSPSQQSTSQSC